MGKRENDKLLNDELPIGMTNDEYRRYIHKKLKAVHSNRLLRYICIFLNKIIKEWH